MCRFSRPPRSVVFQRIIISGCFFFGIKIDLLSSFIETVIFGFYAYFKDIFYWIYSRDIPYYLLSKDESAILSKWNNRIFLSWLYLIKLIYLHILVYVVAHQMTIPECKSSKNLFEIIKLFFLFHRTPYAQLGRRGDTYHPFTHFFHALRSFIGSPISFMDFPLVLPMLVTCSHVNLGLSLLLLLLS